MNSTPWYFHDLLLSFQNFQIIILHKTGAYLKILDLEKVRIGILKGTLRRRLSHGYFSFIAKYTSN